MNEQYGAMEAAGGFPLRANTVSLKLTDLTPEDMLLERNPPAIGFTLIDPVPDLTCYGGSGPETIRLQERIELRFAAPFQGRTRINCTARRADGRWHWFGMQYLPR